MINVKLDKKAKATVSKTLDLGEGQSGIDISPLIVLKNGAKVKIDFSKYNYTIYEASAITYQYGRSLFESHPEYDTLVYPDQGDGSFPFIPYFVIVFKNSAENQLIAVLHDTYTYQEYTQQIVIYEGDVSGLEDTTTIADQLPTVEFTLANMKEGIMVIKIGSNIISQ